jgi:hypothetical protein
LDSRGLQSKWLLKHWVHPTAFFYLRFKICFTVLFVFNLGSESVSSIEDVINWLLENPDMSGSEMMESDGREAAAVEGIANSLSFLKNHNFHC